MRRARSLAQLRGRDLLNTNLLSFLCSMVGQGCRRLGKLVGVIVCTYVVKFGEEAEIGDVID